MKTNWLIMPGRIKAEVHGFGKRCSPEFLQQLNDFVRSKIRAACNTHNGGKKTLDAEVAAYVGVTAFTHR